MALWQYCRETAHNAAVLRLSANVPKAPRLNSLFKPCAGQSVWRNLIRRHCRLHNDIARILLAGDGQFGELPQSLPKNACFGKSSSFATNARLKAGYIQSISKYPALLMRRRSGLLPLSALRNACHWHFLFFSRLYNIICFNFKPALCGKLTNGIIYIFFKIYRVIME